MYIERERFCSSIESWLLICCGSMEIVPFEIGIVLDGRCHVGGGGELSLAGSEK